MSADRLNGAFFVNGSRTSIFTRTLAVGVSLMALSFAHQAQAQDSAVFDIAHPNVSVDLSVLDDGGIGPAISVAPTRSVTAGHLVPGSMMPVSTLYITPQGKFKAIAAPAKPAKVVLTKPKSAPLPVAKAEAEPEAKTETPPPAPVIAKTPEPPKAVVAKAEPTAPVPDPVPVAPVTKAPEPEPAPVIKTAKVEPKSELPEPPEPAPVPKAPEPPAQAPEPPEMPAAVKAEPQPEAKPVELQATPTAPPPPAPAVVAEPASAPPAAPVVGEVVAKLPEAPAPAAEVTAPAAPEVASIPPAGPTLKDGYNLRVVFEVGTSKLPGDVRATLQELAQGMRSQEGLRLQLLAYAGGADMASSAARRLSLSRALAVRSFLIENGVRSTRIDVRALGNKTTEAETERVDITVIER